MRHLPALVLAFALAGAAALGAAPGHGHLRRVALFSFAVSAFRTRLG